MTPDEFAFAASLIRTRTGFVLTRDKAYIVENRLSPVVRRHRLKDTGELIGLVRGGAEDLTAELLDAMMTKDTGFFRDWKPFVHLRDETLRDLSLARAADRTLRILCAGVSTGQEAYSTALTVLESGWFLSDWNIDILGVDLSAAALAVASRGGYTQFEVQRGLPVRVLVHHFVKHLDLWVLDDAVRRMVEFKVWNLLDDLTPLGRFDVVLCRNVLAYFDLSSKADVLGKLAGAMAGDGRLYLGAAETTAGVAEGFRTIDGGLAVFARV